jgi:peptidoglycan/xylan/chitin deacetylase (PgdA/CDA1 family)
VRAIAAVIVGKGGDDARLRFASVLRRDLWLWLTIGVHVVALIALIFVPSSLHFVALALVCNHAFIATASMLPRSSLLGPNLRRLPSSQSDRQVVLTFDDGPDPEVTPRVLQILGRCRAQATFFCVAERAERHPDIVRAIVDGGHRVENHSLKHAPYFALLGRDAMMEEVARAQKILSRLAGRPPRYFRPPAGMKNPCVDFVLRALGLELVSWTRRGFDTVTRDPQRVLRRLTRGLREGDILLLHDGSSARTSDGTTVVLEVLPLLLDALSRNNLRAVAMPDLVDSNVLRACEETTVASESRTPAR